MSGPVPTQSHESTIQALEPLYPRLSPGASFIGRDAMSGALTSDGLFTLLDGVEIVYE